MNDNTRWAQTLGGIFMYKNYTKHMQNSYLNFIVNYVSKWYY